MDQAAVLRSTATCVVLDGSKVEWDPSLRTMGFVWVARGGLGTFIRWVGTPAPHLPLMGGSLPWLLQSHDRHVRGGISSYKGAALGMVEIDPIHISCWEPLKLIA